MAPPENHFHAVQFYKDDASLAKTVGRFFADGLRAGEPGGVIATPAHIKAIVDGLAAEGFKASDLRRTGTLQTFDADKVLATFMVGNVPDPLLFRSNVGEVIEGLCEGRKPCPIRAYGEMV